MTKETDDSATLVSQVTEKVANLKATPQTIKPVE